MSENQVNNAPAAEEETAQDINILKKVRLEKLADLKSRNADPYQITKFDVTAKAGEVKAKYEADEADIIAAAGGDEEKVKAGLDEMKSNVLKIAGRIMSWRDMGKANFIDIRDNTDRIQVYVRSNDIGKEEFAEFKKWDIGDIVGIEGFVFRTRKGEISIHAQKITLLSKSLLPLPENPDELPPPWNIPLSTGKYRVFLVHDALLGPTGTLTFGKGPPPQKPPDSFCCRLPCY